MRPSQPVRLIDDTTKAQKKFYSVVTNDVIHALNLQHISIFNADPTLKVVLYKLVPINANLVGVTGVVVRYEVKQVTAAHSGGTLTTPNALDSVDGPCPAGITIRTGATLTEGNLLFPLTMSNDEISTSTAASDNTIRSTFNQLTLNVPDKNLTLRPNEGLTVKQITNSTIGRTAWLIVFSVEPI